MDRGIGGYLELENYQGEHYHKNAIALNCGRGGLAYLIELRRIKAVWLPDFMCDSVSALFRREKVKIHTYKIGKDFLPIYDFGVADDEWLLVNDYYGQIQKADVDQACKYSNGRLIVDETQGFFRQPWKNADTIYSCRKWFGVADGGYLVTCDGRRLQRELVQDESHNRMAHVLGRFERPSSEFYDRASANNEFFGDQPAKYMSLITENLLRIVDYEEVKERRNRNWKYLEKCLGDTNQMNPLKPDVPFMYPYLTEDTTGMRSLLAEKKIFVPILWPNVLKECGRDSVAYGYANNIMPLPIDQRYGLYEMDYIVSAMLER